MLPGGRVGVVTTEGMLTLADLRSGELLAEKSGFDKGLLCAALSADGGVLVTGHTNTTALVWDVRAC